MLIQRIIIAHRLTQCHYLPVLSSFWQWTK